MSSGQPGPSCRTPGRRSPSIPGGRLPPACMTIDPVLGEIAALRRELKLTWEGHEREHSQHEIAHAREHAFTAEALKVAAELAKENKKDSNEWRAAMDDRENQFATREDIKAILVRLDKIERNELVRDERERQMAAEAAKDRTEAERRQSRQQWVVGIVVTFVVIVVNLVIRLLTT